MSILWSVVWCCRQCTWYYTHYGVGFAAEDAALGGTEAYADSDRPSHPDHPFAASVTNGVQEAPVEGEAGGDADSGPAPTSTLFAQNLNFFGCLGGFSSGLILRRLAIGVDSVASLHEVLLYSTLMVRLCGLSSSMGARSSTGIKQVLSTRFAKGFVPVFQEAVFRRLLSLTQEDVKDYGSTAVSSAGCSLLPPRFRGNCSDVIDFIYTDVERLVKLVGIADLDEKLELFQLEFARQLFSGDFSIGVRIKGLGIISTFLTMAARREVRDNRGVASAVLSSITGTQDDGDPMTNWLSANYLGIWLRKHDLAGVALGLAGGNKTVHIELLARMDSILLFLAERDLLVAAHRDLLWALAGFAGEEEWQRGCGGLELSDRPRVVKLLLATLPKLSCVAVNQLAAKLDAFRPDDTCVLLEDAQVEAIRCVFIASNEQNIKTGALEATTLSPALTGAVELLWDDLMEVNAAADGNALSPLAQHRAAVIADVICQPFPGSLRLLHKYIGLCIRNWKTNVAIVGTIALMRCLLGAIGSVRSSARRLQAFMKMIQSEYAPGAVVEGMGCIHPNVLINASQLIGFCDREYDLMAVAFRDVTRHLGVINATFPVDSSNSWAGNMHDGNDTYKLLCSSLRARLDFIIYLLRTCQSGDSQAGSKGPGGILTIDFAHINMMWIQFSVCCMQGTLLWFVGEVCRAGVAGVPQAPPSLTVETLQNILVDICQASAYERTEADLNRTLSSVTSGGSTSSSEDVAECELRFAELDVDGYRCIEILFVIVNIHNMSLTRSSVNGQVMTVVKDLGSLLGLNCLMSCVLQCRDGQVLEAATAMCVSAHMELAQTLDKTAVWHEFTQQIVRLLSARYDRYKELKAGGDQTTVGASVEILLIEMVRLIRLLSKFLVESKECVYRCAGTESVAKRAAEYRVFTVFYKEESGCVEDAPAAVSSGPGAVVKSKASVEPPCKYLTYLFPLGEELLTVGRLRSRVAKDLSQTDPQLVRLVVNGRTISTAADAELMSRVTVSAVLDAVILQKADGVPEGTPSFKRSSPMSTIDDFPSSAHMRPRHAIANSRAALNMILDLILVADGNVSNAGAASDCVQAAWDLLSLLPTNSEIRKEIVTLGGQYEKDEKREGEEVAAVVCTDAVKWSEMFGPIQDSDIAQLWYRVNIMSSATCRVLADEYSGEVQKREAQRWMESFVRHGGMRYAMDLLVCLFKAARTQDGATENRLPSRFSSDSLKELCIVDILEFVSICLPLLAKSPTTCVAADPVGDTGIESESDASSDEKENSDTESTVSASDSVRLADIAIGDLLVEDQTESSLDLKRFALGDMLGSDFDYAELMHLILGMMHRIVSAEFQELGPASAERASQGRGRGDLGGLGNKLIGYYVKTVVTLAAIKPALLKFIVESSEDTSTGAGSGCGGELVDILLKSVDKSQRLDVFHGLLTLSGIVHDGGGQSDVGEDVESDLSSADQLIYLLLPYLTSPFASWAGASAALPTYYCEEYYRLLSALITKSASIQLSCLQSASFSAEDKGFVVAGSFNTLNIYCILQHLVGDMRGNPHVVEFCDDGAEQAGASDTLLRGQLTLISGLMLRFVHQAAQEEDDFKWLVGMGEGLQLIDLLCDRVLFGSVCSVVESATPTSGNRLPKAKTIRTRALAFNLLHFLSLNCPRNHAHIVCVVGKHHQLAIPLDENFLLAVGSELNNKNHINATPAGLIPLMSSVRVNSALSNTCIMAHAMARIKQASFVRGPMRDPFGTVLRISDDLGSYTGIDNPSCLCYMISCLQQFFMIPGFRQGVLDILPLGADGGGEGAGEVLSLRSDNVLHQLQLLFTFLQESDKSSTEITRFCFSFKDYDDNPTDLLVQQDASEFITNFFQRIEYKVMGTPQENLVKDMFGGVIVNQLRATTDAGEDEGGLRFSSDRPEPFYLIAVSVTLSASDTTPDLHAGMTEFIAQEMVDYTWEKTDADSGTVRKHCLPTSKRSVIKTLPKCLIFHLKRFEFNFETMQHVKVNERFEFPLVLDMFQFTIEGLAAAEAGDGSGEEDAAEVLRRHTMLGCVYELGGVVVHSGTANSGHYYSFIKERGVFSRTGASDKQNTVTKWFEFNDSAVREFSVHEELELQTFGGELPNKDPAAPRRLRTRNAFMLFYDRVCAGPTEEEKTGLEEAAASDNSALELVSSVYRCKAQFYATIPPRLLSVIAHDNRALWMSKLVYDQANYYPFMEQLFNLLAPAAVVEAENKTKGQVQCADAAAFDCMVRFVFGTLVQDKATGPLLLWCERVTSMVQGQQALQENYYCVWALLSALVGACSTDPKFVASLLIQMETAELRTAVTNAMVTAIAAFAPPTEVGVLNRLARENPDRNLTVTMDAPAVACLSSAAAVALDTELVAWNLVECAHVSLREVQQFHFRKLKTYFKPLCTFLSVGPGCSVWGARRGFLGKLLSLFLGSQTPFPEFVGGAEPAEHKSRSMTTVINVPTGNGTGTVAQTVKADCSTLLQCVATMLKYSVFPGPGGGEVFPVAYPPLRGIDTPDATSAVVLKPTYALSTEEVQMLRSKPFVARLILEASTRRFQYRSVKPILTRLVHGSAVATGDVTDVLVEYLHIWEDPAKIKCVMRCVMILCAVQDTLQSARVCLQPPTRGKSADIVGAARANVLGRVLRELQTNSKYVQVTDTALEMLMRALKHNRALCESVSEDMRNQGAASQGQGETVKLGGSWAWVETFLLARRNGGMTSTMVYEKPGDIELTEGYAAEEEARWRGGGAAKARAGKERLDSGSGEGSSGLFSSMWSSVKSTFGGTDDGAEAGGGMTGLYNSMVVRPAAVEMGAGRFGNPVARGFGDPTVQLEALRRVVDKQPLDAVYDSDDDPVDYIGESICIVCEKQGSAGAVAKKPAPRGYSGIIRSYDEDAGAHEIVFDEDNSKQRFLLAQYNWKFID